ncbi:hypothetical protein CH252_18945 [Rhodococcus sp. 06-1477-1B]|nr:hypothetical protein CH252_18945 [Rhodococcus sp. 06-1477-1B]
MAPEPVAAHVAYLQGFGYTYAQIARAAGVNEGTPLRLVRNRLKFVQIHVGRSLLAVRPNISHLDLHTKIPARGVHRRLQALATQGWSIAAVADHIGASRSHLSHLAWNAGVTVRNHLLIAKAYEQLWKAAPPSRDKWEARTILRTRKRAANLGWIPPLAWDDIDYDDAPQQPEPSAENDVIAIALAVSGGSRVQLTRAERKEAVRQLNALHRTDKQIAAMLGCTEQTVMRDRREIGAGPAVGHDRQPIIGARTA